MKNDNLPMMNDGDIECISKQLLSMGDIDVLEWGTGNSTLYFPDLLKANGVNFRWDSVEHNPKWYKKIHDYNKNLEVKLHLFQHDNPLDKKTVNDDPMDNYVNAPRMLWRMYDVIFVDGMHRIRCLKMVRQFLKKDAIIFFHDAERECYHKAFKEYDGKLLTKTLWMGRI